MRHLIAIVALVAALIPCASKAANPPPIHVGSIYATKTGTGATPVVLIPGLGCGPWVWRAFVESLPPNTYTVYEVTLAGFDGTPAIPGPARFDGYAQSIVTLIRNERLARPVIIGHSMGGELGLRIGESEPSLVRGLVIVDAFPMFPPLAPDETLDARRTQWKTIVAQMTAESDADFAASQRKAIAHMVTDPATADDIARRSQTSDRQTQVESAAELATTDLGKSLAQLSAPALVLGASSSGFSIDATQKFYEQQYAGAKNLSVTIVPNSRHFIMLDQPAAFRTAVLQFMASLH
jgi:pimeloyl-ACP methyl ester carboxylesterase